MNTYTIKHKKKEKIALPTAYRWLQRDRCLVLLPVQAPILMGHNRLRDQNVVLQGYLERETKNRDDQGEKGI